MSQALQEYYKNFSIEVDMVVPDAVHAAELYVKVFGAKKITITDEPKGTNEAILNLKGLYVHLLDENPEYMLIAPKEGDSKPIWLNIIFSDIASVVQRAIESNFHIIQPSTEVKGMGVSNAIIQDPYGYVWLLHERSA